MLDLTQPTKKKTLQNTWISYKQNGIWLLEFMFYSNRVCCIQKCFPKNTRCSEKVNVKKVFENISAQPADFQRPQKKTYVLDPNARG